LTLPYISMGWTSLLFTSMAFGMVISVSKHITGLKLEQDSDSLTDNKVELDD
jgi:cell division protein FtsW (lipid II flippase)